MISRQKLLCTISMALLASCGTQPAKPQVAEKLDAQQRPLIRSEAGDHRAQGLAFYRQWEQTRELEVLRKAEEHLSAALADQPDDVRYQRLYYDVVMSLAIFADSMSAFFSSIGEGVEVRRLAEAKDWQHVLEEQFEAMHPSLKQGDLPPPAVATYLGERVMKKALEGQRSAPIEAAEQQPQKESLEVQRAALIKAVQQQPQHVASWLNLSEVLSDTREYHLALQAAKTAASLNGDVADVNYRLGRAYYILSEIDGCSGANDPYLRKSAPAMAKAAHQAPDNSRYAFSAAFTYNALEVYPLALSVARESNARNSTPALMEQKADALLGLGRLDEAEALYQQLLDTGNHWGALHGLYSVAIHRGHWQAARDYLVESRQDFPESVYSQLMEYWLERLAGKTTELPILPVNEADPWSVAVADYAILGEASDALAARARNACQLAEAHFYQAMQYWEAGDSEGARRELEQAKATKAGKHVDHALARAFLASGAF